MAGPSSSSSSLQQLSIGLRHEFRSTTPVWSPRWAQTQWQLTSPMLFILELARCSHHAVDLLPLPCLTRKQGPPATQPRSPPGWQSGKPSSHLRCCSEAAPQPGCSFHVARCPGLLLLAATAADATMPYKDGCDVCRTCVLSLQRCLVADPEILAQSALCSCCSAIFHKCRRHT